VLTGQQVEEARVGSDPHTGDPIVELAFDPVGARLLERMSSERIGSRLVTTLDDRVVTAAVIRDRIAGGRAVIAMGTADRAAALAAAHDLALAIQAGALPAPLRLVSSRTFALP
jgi:preprotein translocase subunit SecD